MSKTRKAKPHKDREAEFLNLLVAYPCKPALISG
jgi:hypothetical protein